MLYVHAHGPGLIHTVKKPVTKLEDLKGMKIRSTGLASKIITALGASPVGTTMPETYDALRTGVAEGATAPIQALKGFRWGEVVKYTILNYGSSYSTGFFVAMNKSQVERSASGYSEDIRAGERGVDREDRRPLGFDR